MAHADALVENIALSLPETFGLGHVLKVFQDTALQVIDLGHALTQQIVRRFFAANAARAEHGDALVVEPVLVGLPPRGKIAETAGAGVDRAAEGADLDLVVIARVDHGHIGFADQRVPVLRRDIVADAGARVDVGLAHGHDLALEADFHATEGLGLGKAFLVLQVCTAGQGAEMCEHRIDPGSAAGDGAIDPLGGNQERALDPLRFGKGQKRPFQCGRVGKTGEVIEGGDGEHGLHLPRCLSQCK